MAGFTHFDKEGKARMVDVSDKAETERVATAQGSVIMQPTTLALIKQGGVKLDGEPIPAGSLDMAPEALDGRVLQVGKRRFRRLSAGLGKAPS